MRRSMLLLALGACNDYHIGEKDGGGDPTIDSDGQGIGLCSTDLKPHAIEKGPGCAEYEIGNFNPWVEFTGIKGHNSLALPVVADLDGQMPPEILVNVLPRTSFAFGRGELWAVHGDGDPTPLFKVKDAGLGFGAAPAVGDLDGDGDLEIVAVRAVGSQFPGIPLDKTDYRVVAWDHAGAELWESEPFRKTDFDYGTAVAISDMDHDGSPEIVAGRVILHADGTTRGVGKHGRGTYAGTSGIAAVNNIGEGSLVAIADLDLDGTEEVIAGDAWYDPDGNDVWYDPNGDDGTVAVANLDDDPEGEVVVITGSTVRALDTDGTKMWGRVQLYCENLAVCDDPQNPATQYPIKANIASAPAIDDIDDDGHPEIVVAAGSQVVALNHDGSELWKQSDVVRDLSGATGASIFDFDGDGTLEVVYIDEVGMYAFDGMTGDVRFQTDKHASNTMFDYPTIADVDADGQAEIVVAHAGFGWAISVYGSGDGLWAPTRKIWNQHAYCIANVDDDGSIPVDSGQGFVRYGSWHSAYDPRLIAPQDRIDLAAIDGGVCEAECEAGFLHLYVQAANVAPRLAADPGVQVALYARRAGELRLVGTTSTAAALDPGTTSDALEFTVDAETASHADAFVVVVDDDGTGQGALEECGDGNNTVTIRGPFCR
jgi:hypothetical protein